MKEKISILRQKRTGWHFLIQTKNKKENCSILGQKQKGCYVKLQNRKHSGVQEMLRGTEEVGGNGGVKMPYLFYGVRTRMHPLNLITLEI